MKTRFGVVVAFALGMVAMLSTYAHATIDSTAATAVTGAAGDLKDTLVSVATTILPYAAAIAVFLVGWRLVRRVVKA